MTTPSGFGTNTFGTSSLGNTAGSVFGATSLGPKSSEEEPKSSGTPATKSAFGGGSAFGSTSGSSAFSTSSSFGSTSGSGPSAFSASFGSKTKEEDPKSSGTTATGAIGFSASSINPPSSSSTGFGATSFGSKSSGTAETSKSGFGSFGSTSGPDSSGFIPGLFAPKTKEGDSKFSETTTSGFSASSFGTKTSPSSTGFGASQAFGSKSTEEESKTPFGTSGFSVPLSGNGVATSFGSKSSGEESKFSSGTTQTRETGVGSFSVPFGTTTSGDGGLQKSDGEKFRSVETRTTTVREEVGPVRKESRDDFQKKRDEQFENRRRGLDMLSGHPVFDQELDVRLDRDCTVTYRNNNILCMISPSLLLIILEGRDLRVVSLNPFSTGYVELLCNPPLEFDIESVTPNTSL